MQPTSNHDAPITTPLADTLVAALEDLKAVNISVLDVRTLTSLADTMIIASGTSSRHVKALADQVQDKAREAGYRPIGVEGEREADWILVDFGSAIVHVMLPATRGFYDLERLWGAQPS